MINNPKFSSKPEKSTQRAHAHTEALTGTNITTQILLAYHAGQGMEKQGKTNVISNRGFARPKRISKSKLVFYNNNDTV